MVPAASLYASRWAGAALVPPGLRRIAVDCTGSVHLVQADFVPQQHASTDATDATGLPGGVSRWPLQGRPKAKNLPLPALLPCRCRRQRQGNREVKTRMAPL